MKYITNLFALIASIGITTSANSSAISTMPENALSLNNVEEITDITPLDLQLSSSNMVSFKTAWHTSHYSHSSHRSHSSHSSHYSSRW